MCLADTELKAFFLVELDYDMPVGQRAGRAPTRRNRRVGAALRTATPTCFALKKLLASIAATARAQEPPAHGVRKHVTRRDGAERAVPS